LKHFELNYGKLSSGNNEIDDFLRNNYCKSTRLEEIIEWTPHDRLKNITHIVDKKSSEVHTISWLNGYIYNWNKDKLTWNRKNKLKVTLIYFEKLNDLCYNKVNFLRL
jgi:hypothetical protein